MSHVATQIRARVKAVLQSGVSLVEDDAIYTSRFFATSVLPCIAIYDRNERIRNEGAELDAPLNAPVTYSRETDFLIEIRSTDTDDPDAACDAIRVQVEEAMAGDRTLNSLAVEADLLSTSKQHVPGEEPIVACTLIYRVWYRTTALDVETAIS